MRVEESNLVGQQLALFHLYHSLYASYKNSVIGSKERIDYLQQLVDLERYARGLYGDGFTVKLRRSVEGGVLLERGVCL